MMHEELRKDLLKGRRIYKVFVGESHPKPTYSYATMSKPRQSVINALLERYSHCKFYITENGKEIFRYKPPEPVKEVLAGEYSNKSFN